MPATLEERVARLEAELKAFEVRMAEVEKAAKKKGMIQLILQYGAPFALWYAFCWASMWFSLYTLLELEIVSWQDSLRPLFEYYGMESYINRVDPSMGNVVIAFVVNECIEPIRIPLVLATGPPIIRLFGRLRGGQAAAAAASTAARS